MKTIYNTIQSYFLIIALGITTLSLTAQDKYGDIWVAGLFPVIAKAYLPDFPNTAILPINDTNIIYGTSACISDEDGNLQFYTNGAQVLMPDGEVMENGYGLSPDALYKSISGIPCDQGALILPSIENESQYLIFHFSVDTSFLVGGFATPVTTKLYYTVVDMSENMGKGKVISKNNILLSNVLLDNSRMTACKHANGRDWWLVKTHLTKGVYYKFLYTPQGIEGPFIQEIGDDFGGHMTGYAKFSEDGTKFATIAHLGPCVVMDFNRCTGEFARPFSIKNLYDSDSIYGGIGVTFSPSGRFLYVNSIYTINQYDLWSSKRDSIRIFTDGNKLGDPVDPGHWLIDMPQLAPNGKIYLATRNGGIPALHVIHQPDSLGLGCQFVAFGQPVNTVNAMTLPNMPNYRLGKLVGSPCDTLVSVGIPQLSRQEGFTARFAPNPANGYTALLYQIEENTTATLVLTNQLGQYALEIKIDGKQNRADIPIANLMQGIYFYKVTNHLGEVISGKLEIFK